MGKRTRTATQEPLPDKPTPSNSSDVTVDGIDYTAVKEGLATVLFPKRRVITGKDGKDLEVEGEVFYNPIQQFNRDLSVLAIKAFSEIYFEDKKNKKPTRRADKKVTERRERERQNRATSSGDVRAETVAGVTNVEETSSNTDAQFDLPKRAPKFTILDALSASGLRAIRYALELPVVTSATANDLDPSALEAMRRNIGYNKNNSTTVVPEGLSPQDAMSKIHPNHGNAQHYMYSVLSSPISKDSTGDTRRGKYEVIDLDPYGSAAPFLDAAVQAVSDGGMLCITCTDAGVWASTGYSEKCYALYGGLPAKGEWCHEAGLRLILHAVATSASKYGLHMEPLLSLSVDFYARVWVRIRNSPVNVKHLASKSMVVYNCDAGCGSWYPQSLGKAKECTSKNGVDTFHKFGLARAPTIGENCPECGFAMHLAGPMWSGPLHSGSFVRRIVSILPPADNPIYGTIPRIHGMLQTALQEIPLDDSPFFHLPSRLSKIIHTEAPSNAGFRGALMGLGYKVARSHCKPSSVKTNAPHSVIWEVMRRWTEETSWKQESVKEGTPGFPIVNKPKDESLKIAFDKELGQEADKAEGIVRYQVNPTANWGPMTKAAPRPVQAPVTVPTDSPESKKRKVE